MSKTLYFIGFTDWDSDSRRDCLVYADTPQEAYDLWAALQLEGSEWDASLELAGTFKADDGVSWDEDNCNVYAVAADNGGSRALAWHTDDMKFLGSVEKL